MPDPAAGRLPVSVLVPVRNEAANLPRCLASVAWADEVWVVDSGSTDGTRAVAESLGARVVDFAYRPPYPKKKEWSLRNLPFAHEWVLLLDADEVLADDAAAEIGAIVRDRAETRAGYWINRRFQFLGQWLRHAYFPNWNLRLVRHARARFERLTDAETHSGDNEVHEHLLVDGETGRLRTLMDHYAFPTVESFVEKHNRYSNWEATVDLAPLEAAGDGPQHGHVRWRRRLKRWLGRSPLRPQLRFLYVYLVQGGILDGRAGFHFARLHEFYEVMIAAKRLELRRAAARESSSTSLPSASRPSPRTPIRA